MNATGKQMRKSKGMTRAQLHFASHANQSDAKRKRSGWGPKGKRAEMKAGKFSREF
jgi:hypothetical protein